MLNKPIVERMSELTYSRQIIFDDNHIVFAYNTKNEEGRDATTSQAFIPLHINVVGQTQ